MTILLNSPVLFSGVPVLAGTKLNLDIAKESELVNRGVATWSGVNPTIGLVDKKLNFPEDTRRLAKWFDGGIAGKKVVLSGDSTTWHFQNVFAAGLRIYRDGRYGRIQQKYPEFRDVTVYCRGENGAQLASLLSGPFSDNHRNDPTSNFYSIDTYGSLSAIIALNADVYVFSWGINDCRTGTAYTAAILQADLTTLVNTVRAALPDACIILRMPNAHATDNIGGNLSGGATAQNTMDRYQTAYNNLRNTWPNVVVWNSHMGLSPVVAPAAAAGCPLIATDSLHPSASGYDQILDNIFGLLTPAENYRDIDYFGEGTRSAPFKNNQTNRLIRWDPDIDPRVLDGPDWYKVYKVQFSDGTRASYIRINFIDTDMLTSATVQANAWASGVAAQGIVPGDIISFGNLAGQAYTFVVNTLTPTQFSAGVLQYAPHPAGTWSAAETEDLIAGHPVPTAGVYVYGYVYRHKYAHCEAMRKLQSLFVPGLSYDNAVATVNNYAVKRRFYISATPALGAFTAQTIGSETGGDLSLRTWAVTDTVCIPGVSSGSKTSEMINALKLPLTGATFTADTTNKRMAVTGVTSGGVLVDFSKYVIPQGYVLSAT